MSSKLVNLQHFKIKTMKRKFSLPLLAVAISLSAVACKGNKTGNGSDSTKDSLKVDSSVKTKTDTSVKVDTAKMPGDTGVKKDTVSKTTTKTTVSKKTEVKKSH